MLIRIFKANYFYNYLLFPVVGILLLLKSFLTPGAFPPETTASISPIFKPIYNLPFTHTTSLAINFAAVMIICFQLLYINATFSFIRERTFLTVYLFMFIVFALPNLHSIQPVFVAAIFILLAFFSIFKSFEKKKVISNGFNAGLFTGIAGLFYPSLNLLIFLVPISLYILKNKIGWREWIASFIGLSLPVIYSFTCYFLTNSLTPFYELYTSVFLPKDYSLLRQLPVLIYLGFLSVIIIAASFFILKQYDEKKISTRRFYKIAFFYFATSLLLIIIPSVSHELLVILTLPLTFLLSNYLTFMRRRFWAELIFTLLIIFSVALQYVIK
jgi:hypothetical protein